MLRECKFGIDILYLDGWVDQMNIALFLTTDPEYDLVTVIVKVIKHID